MEQAKQAVKNVLSRSGNHDTEVDERVNPAVTSETVKPTRHEESTQAIDREVHQHHYHTTVQPLAHKEVLPEEHVHQQLPVQEREFTHGDSDRVRSSVDAEAAKFADTSRTVNTQHTASTAPTVTGEHVHHHVHETVQPVVHKETIQPEVVHKTIPIHETHHAQAEHHGLSTLPVKTLDEFKSIGGSVVGGSTRHEEYEGHPRPYNPQMQVSRSDADHNPMKHDGLHGSHGTSTGAAVGAAASSLTGSHHTGTDNTRTAGGLTGSHHTGTGSTGLTGTDNTRTGGLTGSHHTGTESTGLTGIDNSRTTGGLTGSHHTGTGSTGLTGSDTTGTTGGLTGTRGTNVSGVGNDYSTGTALGGRAEGNTASRALESAAGHGTTGTTSGLGDTDSSTARGLDHTRSAGGADIPSNTRDKADTYDSTKISNTGNTGDVSSSDVQHSSQGKDPSLVEGRSSGGKWTGEGVDGSHSAVFGLTPDGHKYNDTAHRTTPLKDASSTPENQSTGTASRGAGSAGVAEQMNDPRVAEKGHGGPAVGDTGSGKPGAGAVGGSQGLGEIRPGDHGTSGKISDKLDPTTDADGDGKRGVMD